MVTVKVVWKSSGKPAKDQKVALGIDTIFSGGITKSQWTGSDGEAHFDVSPNPGKIFVNGSTKYQGHLSGRMMVYI